LLGHLDLHLLDLGELLLHDLLCICPIPAQGQETLRESSDWSNWFTKQFLCFRMVGIDRVKLAIEVSEAAFLVLDHVLRVGSILDNRVEQSLAPFEEAGATFGLSCASAHHH
jgi:hypothetical protein